MNAHCNTPATIRFVRQEPVPTPQDLLDLDRGEDEGMSEASVKEIPSGVPVGPAPHSQPARHAGDAARDTDTADLERRILGQERVLESVIAYLAAADPDLLENLRRTFVDPMQMVQHEQDYMEPEQYAEAFVRALIGRAEASRQRPAAPAAATRQKWPSAMSRSASFAAPQYSIQKRNGVWKLTKFGKFFGHYFQEIDAISAADLDGRSSSVQIEPRHSRRSPRTAE